MTGPLLSAERLTVRFGGLTAVDAVSLALAPGEVVGLLGANGAGKTTLLRVLLGLIAPTSGTSSLLGGPPDREHRRLLGYLPQGLGLYPDLTVAENIAFVASTYQAPAPALQPPLNAVADRLVRDLSLGMQRQAAFACALLHQPVLLVLDEPTSGVAPLAGARLWDVIHEQAAAGVGSLVTTHSMQEAEQCDRLLLMSGGRLVGSGTAADIIGTTRAVAVTAADWTATFEALDRAGLPVTLSGRHVRVADRDPAEVLQVLQQAGITAQAQSVPATIEERMMVLSAPAASLG